MGRRDYQYLIAGGGMAAHQAALGIREVDGSGRIGMLCREPYRPYKRPSLSKALWRGEPLDSIWLDMQIEELVVHTERDAVRLDRGSRTVIDSRGDEYRYGKLLIATGGRPRKLGHDGAPILYYRSVDDYRRVRSLSEQRRRFLLIGGGFIGSELAASLAMNGVEVTLAFSEGGIGAKSFPRDLHQYLNRYYAGKGVNVMPDRRIQSVERRGDGIEATTDTGETIRADVCVAGLGIVPNTEVASAAGLAVDDGILVGDDMRTSDPNVFAAGDVARFPSATFRTRTRVEHEDCANATVRVAGRAMAGDSTVRYETVPFFYSDLFDLGYEAVGEVDARHVMLADWTEPFREGVIYYLREQRVRGVLLWNTWSQVDGARAIIAQPGPFEPSDLKGRLQS